MATDMLSYNICTNQAMLCSKVCLVLKMKFAIGIFKRFGIPVNIGILAQITFAPFLLK
jgi:hypothetical protein